MGILDKIKYGIDYPVYRQVSPITAHAAGVSMCTDKRNDISAYDAIFQLTSASNLNVYYGPPNGYASVVNPGLSAFGAGSCCVFVPSFTYVGNIGAGCSTTKIVTTTTLASIATNGFVLAEGLGFKVRIKGNAAGSSGKTEERYIIGNTSGTTPTLYLSAALSFTPISGDTYEIMAGRIYMLGTTAGATQFRSYDIGSGAMTSRANTTLTIATESNMTCLDEQYVPYDRKPGEGFLVGAGTYDTSYISKGCLVATATAAGTITGQASAGDAGVIANEYRNFQIRIVEDTVNVTAVGQRRLIASHTAGASPVYTLGANWAVTPSANAKFVIELPNQILLMTVAASTATYTYNYSGASMTNGTGTIADNAWSSTYYGARAGAIAAGAITFPAWAHEPTTNADGTRLSRHSYIYSFRGGSTTLDMLDIAGGTAGAWTNAIAYNAQLTNLSTGTCGDLAPIDQLGRWGYFVLNNSNLVYRFDVKYLALYPWATLPAQSGTAAVGNRMAVTPYMTAAGADKMSKVYTQGHLSTALYRSEVII